MYNLIQYASGPIKIFNLPIHLYYTIICDPHYVHVSQNCSNIFQNKDLHFNSKYIRRTKINTDMRLQLIVNSIFGIENVVLVLLGLILMTYVDA